MIALFDQYAACLFLLGSLSLSALLAWCIHMAQHREDTSELGRAVGREADRQTRKYGNRWY